VLDSLPGVEMDSSVFTDTLNGYEEFNLSGIEVPSEGIFIGMSSSSELGVILDGFGKGTHTAVYSEGQWSLYTSGEVLMDGFLSYLPSVKKRQSEILSFGLLRASGDTNWTSIASGISDTTFIDTTVMENRGYSYKIEASFSNPADTFFSNPWSIFVDLTIPILGTVILSSSGDTILFSATLIDTSKIYWDSLGYKRNDSLFVIPEDSCSGNNHFFSIYFTEDTLQYYLIVGDSSLIGNIGRYPETGFYYWVKSSGVSEKDYPEETFLAKLGENPIIRNTEVRYGLARGGNVRMVLYDVIGRVAKTLINRKQERGYYSIPLDIGQMPQGVFFLRMRAGDYERTLKLVKLI
ncbi:T9SS type A sorting domain-containing protein, partial [candidate division WOR-3 bacterium]|nr:T9SS type A sorting domain-containing protein [candidate division WOR-3 bacterium]